MRSRDFGSCQPVTRHHGDASTYDARSSVLCGATSTHPSLTPSVSSAWLLDPVSVASHRSTCAPVFPACSSPELLYPGRRLCPSGYLA